MIKQLRIKIVCIIMVIVTVLLTAILGLVCYSTQMQMRTRSLAALKAASPEPMRPGGPGDRERSPSFVLWLLPDGKLDAYGSSYYDLTDSEQLLEILQEAMADDRQTGILHSRNLRFYRMDRGHGVGYAFLDISTEIRTMQTLIFSCICIGIVALAVLFVIAVLLARWLVRPVEEAWNNQRQFISDASHELKTPLTVILTNAELLQSEEYDPSAKQRFARSIQTMSVQMRGLVESMLALARVDDRDARANMEPVDLSALAENCVLPFEPVYFEAGRTLESSIAPDILVQGNAQQLQQVLDILLDNGCKYSRPGSSAQLALVRQGHNSCLLTVATEGAPLSAQQCKDIFKRFYRVDEARSMNHSYGLGLPIAERLIARHRGKIWCQSKAGVNTFSIHLPTINQKHL